MKWFKRILLILLILLVCAAVAGLILINRISRRALPDYDRDIYLSGLQNRVTVLRDAFGVPHLFAENEGDLYRATGYVMAQDRLWQMDLLRRATTGRLAEIFGEDLIETDLLMRALRIPEKSRRVLDGTDPSIIRGLECFAEGVNNCIENMDGKLPPEFAILRYRPEEWFPEHSVNLIGYMAWDLTTAWTSEVRMDRFRRILPPEKYALMLPDGACHSIPVFTEGGMDFSDDRALALNPAAAADRLRSLGLEIFSGSNNWAVSGEKSTTGKPLFSNDMHLSLFAPGIWYQIHQNIPGLLNVTGVILPGTPFITAGHNDRIAWGFTNVMVDDMDFYEETLHPDSPDRYLLNGEWRPMTVTTESIRTSKGKTVERILRFTHRGPIISAFQNIPDRQISMRWIGNEDSNEMRTVYLINRAGNWEEFKNAFRTFRSVSQNVAYADVDGNIGLYSCMGLPIRDGDRAQIAPGDTDRFDWQGIVPFEELPHEYNPERGYISSANNKTVPDSYPYTVSCWFDLPFRIKRIRAMLDAETLVSPDFFKAMLTDVFSGAYEAYVPDLIAVLEKTDLGPLEEKALDSLRRWNGEWEVKSAAAAVFEYFYYLFARNTASDELGEDLLKEWFDNKILVRNLVQNIWKSEECGWYDDVRTEPKETFSLIVEGSFREAVLALQNAMGPDIETWEWGRIHTLTLYHPMGGVSLLNRIFRLNRGPFPVGGSYHTVCPYAFSFNDPFKVNHGASERHLFDLSDWDSSFALIPTGVSGIPASPYYCDQTGLYVEGRFRRDPFSRNEIEKAAVYSMTFFPSSQDSGTGR
ncbi:MAG: penicillin acylase family protein [Acidobacteriota bacterium]